MSMYSWRKRSRSVIARPSDRYEVGSLEELLQGGLVDLARRHHGHVVGRDDEPTRRHLEGAQARPRLTVEVIDGDGRGTVRDHRRGHRGDAVTLDVGDEGAPDAPDRPQCRLDLA